MSGLLEFIMHPDYLGNLIFFFGLFLLSTGATGGTWSIIGPILILFIINKMDLNCQIKLAENDIDSLKKKANDGSCKHCGKSASN